MTESENPKVRSQGLCVLLLEDNDADAYLTRRALARLSEVGHVVRVKNGKEAVELLKSGNVVPDIAFVDLQMPTMDGLDFLSECVDQGLANIPMVVLTSSSAVNDGLRSRVRGALRVITKPESPADLICSLEDAVEAFAAAAKPFQAAADSTTWAALRAEFTPKQSPGAGGGATASPQFGRRKAGA